MTLVIRTLPTVVLKQNWLLQNGKTHLFKLINEVRMYSIIILKV